MGIRNFWSVFFFCFVFHFHFVLNKEQEKTKGSAVKTVLAQQTILLDATQTEVEEKLKTWKSWDTLSYTALRVVCP